MIEPLGYKLKIQPQERSLRGENTLTLPAASTYACEGGVMYKRGAAN